MDIERCFEIMGLAPGASPEEVKQAYRDLADVWHPDRFSHNQRLKQKALEKLKELNLSYEVISGLRKNSSEGFENLDSGRRKHPRKPLTIPVDCLSFDRYYKTFSGDIQNISAGGIYIKINKALSIGQKVSVSFPLPSFGDLFNLAGHIAWKNEQGFGVKFIISDRYRKMLSEFV